MPDADSKITQFLRHYIAITDCAMDALVADRLCKTVQDRGMLSESSLDALQGLLEYYVCLPKADISLVRSLADELPTTIPVRFILARQRWARTRDYLEADRDLLEEELEYLDKIAEQRQMHGYEFAYCKTHDQGFLSHHRPERCATCVCVISGNQGDIEDSDEDIAEFQRLCSAEGGKFTVLQLPLPS